MMKLRSILPVLLAFALLLGGCSAAKMKSNWKADGYSGKSDRILVLGVSSNRAARQIFEAETVDALKKYGVDAIASYVAFGGDKELDRDIVIKYVQEQGIDSVMVTKVLDTKTLTSAPPT